MPSSTPFLRSAVLCGWALLASSGYAQVEPPALIEDPVEAPAPVAPAPVAPPKVEEAAAAEAEEGWEGAEVPELRPPPTRRAAEPPPVAKPPKPAASAPEPPAAAEPAPKAEVPALPVVRKTDAELEDVWGRWRAAHRSGDVAASDDARNALLRLREDLGIAGLESFALGFARASLERQAQDDSTGAVSLALTATELAPDLPAARLRLARAYLYADVTEVARIVREVRLAAGDVWADPRYRLPLLADLATVGLSAWVLTALAVFAVLFARVGKYFLHDFHQLFFPRAVARWQGAVAGGLVLALPIFFRLGLAVVLLTLFGALTLYLSWRERAVALVMLAAVGVVPALGGWAVRSTQFAQTPAEEAWALERADLGAERVAEAVAARAAADRASFLELSALARFELRRGRLPESVAHYKQALALRPGDARAMVNLGNALFASADLEGALAAYQTAAAPSGAGGNAAAFFNLAKLHERRALAGGENAGVERARAQEARSKARDLDPTLASRVDPAPERTNLGTLLLSPAVEADELLPLADVKGPADKVTAQLSRWMLGNLQAPWSPVFPLAAGLVLLGLGALRRFLGAAVPCDKCGRPVSRWADPELPRGSSICDQCVHVFVRSRSVAPAAKVRKQVEIARRNSRLGKVTYALGAALSGAGDLFCGRPVRGALYAFCFFFAVLFLAMRHGLVRWPYGEVPLLARVVPALVVLGCVYWASLRGLHRRQE